jgi:hypothetical protein
MIPREEVELDDVTSYNISDNKIYKISSSQNESGLSKYLMVHE